ncbi:hypothetical protein DB30_00411 [Enhygromyxa salina]|uniref:Uncharacterized protein n=1 Tax=Enhygromyxa salina TaxID=215803 RepID=A0A0C2CZI6_9BACT|nr:hypothetical protein [Enhygromyxa salina]KIG13267.1 hypothetical protein DB30_00411 [Enhygromyxa salina]
MPIPELFTSESLYTPDQWFVHDIVDSGEHHLVGICDTSELTSHPLVVAQRAWPGQPKHVPGAVMVQITGTLGNIHAVTVLNLRMTDGWVGFGTNILDARFRGLGRIGPSLRCELKVEELRELKGQLFVTYAFRFTQEGRAIYKSRQRASWLRAKQPTQA